MDKPSYSRRPVDELSDLRALLDERYGPTGSLLREAVAKPLPKPCVTPDEAAAHRRRLVDAMQMGIGTYGRSREA